MENKFCNKCGAELFEGNEFCSKCGSPTNEADKIEAIEVSPENNSLKNCEMINKKNTKSTRLSKTIICCICCFIAIPFIIVAVINLIFESNSGKESSRLLNKDGTPNKYAIEVEYSRLLNLEDEAIVREMARFGYKTTEKHYNVEIVSDFSYNETNNSWRAETSFVYYREDSEGEITRNTTHSYVTVRFDENGEPYVDI